LTATSRTARTKQAHAKGQPKRGFVPPLVYPTAQRNPARSST